MRERELYRRLNMLKLLKIIGYICAFAFALFLLVPFAWAIGTVLLEAWTMLIGGDYGIINIK